MKVQLFTCLHLYSNNLQKHSHLYFYAVSQGGCATIAKQYSKKCNTHAKLLFYLNKATAFLPFL